MSATRLVLAACICLAGLASAQITIVQGDVPQTIGDSFRYKYLAHDDTVDVGLPGGPHTWTFDTSTYVGYVLTTELVDKASTPFTAWYPDANYATREDRGMYVLYIYDKLGPDSMLECGYGMQFGGGNMVRANTPRALHFKLPATFGTSWSTTYNTYDTLADTVHIVVNRHDCAIDAWGTVVTPAGSWPCLRGSYLGLAVTTTYVSGTPVHVDTSFTRRYMWFAKGKGAVAMVHSMEGDTSTYFTLVADIMVAVGTNTNGVRDPQGGAFAPCLTVRPNPCRRLAVVECVLGRPGPATVSVTDPLGRVVLRSSYSLPAGRTSFSIDLRRLGSGVYFVKLDAGAFSSSQKLLVQTR